jgi:hypothetical protein
MRLLFILCEASVEARITDILDRVKAPGYTRFSGAAGFGCHGRREGSPVWPGLNSIVMTAVPDELLDAISGEIDRLKAERNGRLAIRVFMVPAEELA